MSKIVFSFSSHPYLSLFETWDGIKVYEDGKIESNDGCDSVLVPGVSEKIKEIIEKEYENLKNYEHFENQDICVFDGCEEKYQFLDLKIEGGNLIITNNLINKIALEITEVFIKNSIENMLPEYLLEIASDRSENEF